MSGAATLFFGYNANVKTLILPENRCCENSPATDMILSIRNASSEVLVNRRVVVFVVGGVTYEESRAVHLLNKEFGANVVIGGTSILNFDAFVEDLKVACFV